MGDKLTLNDMIKLGVVFGLPFVIVLKFMFWVNPTTFAGKMTMTVGAIFGYIVLVVIMLYLISLNSLKSTKNISKECE